MYHSNAGPHPAWLLEEVRVREGGAPAWTVFPCGRWLAVHRDDGWVLGGAMGGVVWVVETSGDGPGDKACSVGNCLKECLPKLLILPTALS